MMKMTKGEKIFNVFNIVFLFMILIVTVLPFMYVLTTSIMPTHIVVKYNNSLIVPIPKYIDMSAYKFIFSKESKLLVTFSNTLFVVIVGTSVSLFTTALMAYPLSRKDLKGRTPIMMFVLITMLFNGGLIPTYLVVHATGLINSLWAIIIPSMIAAWNLTLMRNFFSTIPDSIRESALMDGAGELTVLFKIIFPLAVPSLATVGLFYAVFYWNDFQSALFYINSSSKWTLQIYLKQVLVEATPSLLMDERAMDLFFRIPPPVEQVKMATIIAATVPILVVYPFIQKYFVKGMMVGSIKG